MASRFVFTPLAAEFPAANFPQLTLVNRRPALAFDAATDETAYWTGIAPQGLTGTITVLLYFVMASATSNNTVWEAALEAVTPGDATDLDATTSFDAANSSGAVASPGTAGHLAVATITMTNADSIAPGDYFRLAVNRDANNGSDNAAGDALLLGVELRDGA